MNDLVPLSRAVNASLIDTYSDVGKSFQLHSHWAAREFKLLDRQILKTSKRTPVILTVNQSTRTATLPIDFYEETVVAIINNQNLKVYLKTNDYITDTKNIDTVECVDTCPKCNADKAICNDLAITVTTTVVTINDTNYEQTVTKKMSPNGDYYLETYMPVLDIESNTVVFRTSREFVAHIDLKPCGCVEETDSNMATIQLCNPEVFCQHFCGCDTNCHTNYGGYKIFPESGLIQFDYNFKFKQVYLEYRGFLVKKNGQYFIPSIAFEAIVEGTKYRAIKDRKNIPEITIRRKKQDYVDAKNDMRRVLGRSSIIRILNAALTTPKFDLDYDNYYSYCGTTPQVISQPSNECVVQSSSSGSTSNNPAPTTGYVPFSFGVIAGMPGAPIDNTNTWQADFLKGALNLNHFFINDTTYTLAKGDFILDTVAGTINISPNKFFNGDVVVGNYFKIL